MRMSNPVLSENVFAREAQTLAAEPSPQASRVMTVRGAAYATLVLVSLCLASVFATWYALTSGTIGVPPVGVLLGAMLGTLVLGLIAFFAPRSAPFIAPLYALLEGAFLAVISLYTAQMLNAKVGAGVGETVVLQAVLLTFSILVVMLVGYLSGVIRPGRVFMAVVTSATLGVGLFYLVTLGAGLFGFGGLAAWLQGASTGSIVFSLVVVGLASLNLVLDFEFISEHARRGSPKYMEWLAALGLLVTLVWLYLEVLRLLSKMRRR